MRSDTVAICCHRDGSDFETPRSEQLVGTVISQLHRVDVELPKVDVHLRAFAATTDIRVTNRATGRIGDRRDTYAVTVRANWRVTGRVNADRSFTDVDFEDYHGEGGILMRMYDPPHPGESILDLCIEPTGQTITSAAKHLGVSRKHLSEVISGKARISLDLAMRLAQAYGGSAGHLDSFAGFL